MSTTLTTTTTTTTARQTVTAAIAEFSTLVVMFVAALGGRALERAGGKDSDRGPSTLEYVFLAALVVGASAAAGTIIVRKITSKANQIPE